MEEFQIYFFLPYALDLMDLLEQKIFQFESKTDVWISQVRRVKSKYIVVVWVTIHKMIKFLM